MKVEPLHQQCPPTTCNHGWPPETFLPCQCGASSDIDDWMKNAMPTWKKKQLMKLDELFNDTNEN